MADNTMNQGGKSSGDRSRQTNQDPDQAKREQDDMQRSNMGNRRDQDQSRQEEDAEERSNMGNREQGKQQQSGRGNEDMQRSDMGNPSNTPPQPTKTNVPEHEEGMEQKTSGNRDRETRDSDVDTNEGRSGEADLSGRNL